MLLLARIDASPVGVDGQNDYRKYRKYRKLLHPSIQKMLRKRI